MSVVCSKCKTSNRNNAKFCAKCGNTLKPSQKKNEGKLQKILGGRYRIEKPIKRGGMGCVYLGKHVKLDELCAIKEMIFTSTDPKKNQYAMKRFYEEAKLLSRLRHPNLPVVTDYFDENNKYYIVMDYIKGEDLETILRRSGNPGLPENVVIEWAIDVLEVLNYLHSQNPPVIYRDVKPSNIMIRTSDKRVMLVDFGIARAVQGNVYSGQTAIGTFGYAPVEQFRGKVEPGSDLYALGATMYYLLTGAEPTGCIQDPVRKLAPHISKEMEDVLIKALQEDVKDRFPSAEEMKRALEKIKGGEKVSVGTTGSTYSFKNLPPQEIAPKKISSDLKNKKNYRKEIKDTGALENIKNLINNWSKKESWFAKNFGKKLEIIEVNLENAFIISSEVLYMERELKEGNEPSSTLNNKKTDPQKLSYKSLKDFPIMSPPENFTTRLEENYIFDESKEISRCTRCGGAGEVTCKNCRGKGITTKTRLIKDKEASKEKCRSCSGTGKGNCDLCNGYKDIVKYSYFTTRYYPVYFSNVIYSGKLELSNIQNGSKINIYEEEIFNRKKSDSFESNKLKSLHESPLKEHFNSLMGEASSHYKDTKKILNIPVKIKLKIEEMIIREVGFKDKKKNNTLWIYGTGSDSDKIILENRPLLWATDQIIGGVKNMFTGK